MKYKLLSLLFFMVCFGMAFSQEEDKLRLQQQLLLSREQQAEIARQEAAKLQYEKQTKQLSEQERQLLRLRVEQQEAELEEESAKIQAISLRARYQAALKDKFITRQESDLRQNRRWMIYIGSISGLILTAAILIYLSHRRTKRLNALITAQHQELTMVSGVKDRLLAIVGHDMRAPLNMLLSLSQILQNDHIPKAQMNAYMTQLESTLTHTSSMMDNLLYWAASQMQGYRPNIGPVNVAEIATDILLLKEHRAQDKGITLHNHVEAEFSVRCDPDMMMVVVRNLVSNALKFTSSGGTVSISSSGTNGQAVISVADTGIGMSTTLLDQFNSKELSGLESTRGTNKEKGTGLGLLLCKTFIRLMDGQISGTVNPAGSGSVFKIILPHA